MYYVYILTSTRNDKKIYVGLAENVSKRLRQHNEGLSAYTSRFKPWQLVSYVAFLNIQEAEAFELYLKRGSGFAFMKKHLLPRVPAKL